MVTAVSSPSPVIVAETRSPPAVPVTSACGELLLGGLHLLLEQLRLLEELRHVGLAEGVRHAPSVGPRIDIGVTRWARAPVPSNRRPGAAPRRRGRRRDHGCAPGAAPAWRAGRPPSTGGRPARGLPAGRLVTAVAPSAAAALRDALRRALRPPPPAHVVVVLDPGHNGGNARTRPRSRSRCPTAPAAPRPCNTTGTATAAGYPEHAFTWDVAQRTKALLEPAGITVVLTRPDDTGVGPCVDQRALLAGQAGAVAFVGIHGDGAAGGRPRLPRDHLVALPAGPAVKARTTTLATDVRDAMTAVEPVSTYLATTASTCAGTWPG